MAEEVQIACLRQRFSFVFKLALSFRATPSLQTGGGDCSSQHPRQQDPAPLQPCVERRTRKGERVGTIREPKL